MGDASTKCCHRLLQAKSDPAHVQLLYERALAAFPVTTYLWQAYAYYMQDHIKVPAATNSVYSRALRNCPWVGSLWANALRALELQSTCDEQQHASLYSSALQAGLQTAEDYMEVILARLDGLRHISTDDMQALRQGFQQAAELMQTYFPDYIDRSLRLHAYWADCELHIGKDAAGAEAVWENVLKSQMGRYIEPSVAYVTMLVGAGNHAQARRIFKRGYSRNMEENGRVFLCEAWLRFEREHGTAESFAEVGCHVAAGKPVEAVQCNEHESCQRIYHQEVALLGFKRVFIWHLCPVDPTAQTQLLVLVTQQHVRLVLIQA